MANKSVLRGVLKEFRRTSAAGRLFQTRGAKCSPCGRLARLTCPCQKIAAGLYGGSDSHSWFDGCDLSPLWTSHDNRPATSGGHATDELSECNLLGGQQHLCLREICDLQVYGITHCINQWPRMPKIALARHTVMCDVLMLKPFKRSVFRLQTIERFVYGEGGGATSWLLDATWVKKMSPHSWR